MSPPPSSSSKVFGRFHLLRRIGAGGMGEVFLARTTPLGGSPRVCVVKKMLPHLARDTDFVERFLDEAKVLIHLCHPAIARVLEMGGEQGEYILAMEYVQGKTLGKLSAGVRDGPARFPLPLALHIAQRVCDALAYAHCAADPSGRPLHVVHRDISPANVLVSYDGEVKIIDFGAAQSAIKLARTAPRMVIGNLAYMSPEQARKNPVDGRADVYSVGVLLWELAAGQWLTGGGNPVERWRRAAYPRFVPPSLHQPEVPPDVDQLVMRALAPDPAERWQSAKAMGEALSAALRGWAPSTLHANLASLMVSLFEREAAEDRAMVAEAVTEDAETTDRSAKTDPHASEAGRGADPPPEATTRRVPRPSHERRASGNRERPAAAFSDSTPVTREPTFEPEPTSPSSCPPPLPLRRAQEWGRRREEPPGPLPEESTISGATPSASRTQTSSRSHPVLAALLFAVAFALGALIAAATFGALHPQ